MKLVLLLFLISFSFPVMAQWQWNCQLGEAQFSFILSEQNQLTVTEDNASLSDEPQTRVYCVDPNETGYSAFQTSLSFRLQVENDPIYEEQVVDFSTSQGKWVSFYYAYTKANDSSGYIYEYEFNFDSDCDLSADKTQLLEQIESLSKL